MVVAIHWVLMTTIKLSDTQQKYSPPSSCFIMRLTKKTVTPKKKLGSCIGFKIFFYIYSHV
jgi:hypothetical protein